MANPNVLKNVGAFVAVAFLLLGVLFGMQIMTFIFGQLGTSASSTIDDATITVTNRTQAFINETIYTIPEASLSNYVGGFTVIGATNNTNDAVIPATNYTSFAIDGTLTNATIANFGDVNLTYSFVQKTSIKTATESTSNNSLQAIVSYTNQTDTQFNTVAIAITLIVLIAVFLLFWTIFIKGRDKKKGSAGGNFA